MRKWLPEMPHSLYRILGQTDVVQKNCNKFVSHASNNPSYDNWLEDMFKSEIENYSTFEIMKENFGIMDFLFLFLGIGTAFRLGSGLKNT